MTQSFEKSLSNGNLSKFIDLAQKFGTMTALEMMGFRPTGDKYIAARKLGIKETGDENFGLHPKCNTYIQGGIQSFLREVMAGVFEYVIRVSRENEILKMQLEAYRSNSRKTELDFVDEFSGVLDFVK